MPEPGSNVTTCDAIAQELPALVTGELNEAQTQTVESHLLSCERCRQELIEVRKTIGLVARAPLEHGAPPHLEADVFTFLELEPVASAVRTAPLEHEPPAVLERLSMEHAGVVVPGPTRWQRASAYLAPALAASLLIVGFLALTADNQVPGVVGDSQTDPSDEDPGAVAASELGEVTFTQTTSNSIWPEVDGTIEERDNGTFALTVTFEDYPPIVGDDRCRLDLVASDGERITVANFQVSGGNDDGWTTTFELPGDPRAFDSFEMSIESSSGAGSEGPILEAPIDV
ncbi:MAG: anti-sigma factor family protein [Actinomycetota bacterium]